MLVNLIRIHKPCKQRYLNHPIVRVAGFAVFGLLSAIAVAATIIPLFSSKQWYVRIFDYPRLQTLIVAVLALAWYLIFYFEQRPKGYVFTLALLIVIIVQAYKAWPYTPLGTKQVLAAEDTATNQSAISLFICNVLQTNTAYNRVLEKINQYQPDVIITTETDSTWQKQLSVLHQQYPYRVAVPQSNTYGMHLFSRLPLRGSSVRYLLEKEIPSIRTLVQLRSGAWITLFVVHPKPPVPGEASDSKERDAEIIMVGREASQQKGGVIVAGDFNDVAWSETTELFQKVSGFLDPRRGRGFYNTYHAKYPVFRWPLDHIFHSDHFRLEKIERVGTVNSDHFPMYIKLRYEPEKKDEQPNMEQPDTETQKEASETIQKGVTDKDKE